MNLIFLICVSVTLFHLNGHTCFPQASPQDDLMMADFLRLHTSPRIIGGQEVEPGEIPYILSVQWDGDHFCGASIVEGPNGGAHIAVTAAHCVTYEDQVIPTTKLTVTAGILKIDGNAEPTSQTLPVQKVIVHEGYHTNNLGLPVNDIAILFLSGSFQENEYANPIKLPPSNNNDHDGNEKVRISGWGTTENGSQLSPTLLRVDVKLLSNEECAAKYSAIDGNAKVIHDSNIWAGEDDGGKDSCQRDSGGPMASIKAEPILLGITSWGYGCGLPNVPGVYKKVSFFVDWIANVVNVNAKVFDQQ